MGVVWLLCFVLAVDIFCSNDHLLMFDACLSSVVEMCSGLLRDVNEKGAESRNMLSMAGSPDDVDDTQPSYLLRRDLLRVLANLVYKNTDNQNQVSPVGRAASALSGRRSPAFP